MSQPLFRATALARLSSPEQLDERLRIVPPRTWLAFAALATLLLAAGAWSAFARIPLRVSGEGVFSAAPGQAPIVDAFVSAADVPRLRPGLSAWVRSPDAKSLRGEVYRISEHTMPRAQLLVALDNPALVDRLTRNGPMVSVALRFPDGAIPSFPTGTRCTVDIVIGETTPAALLFRR